MIGKLFFKLLKLAFGLVVLLALLVCAARFYPEKFLSVDSGQVSADIIVVLGGGADRPARAAELFKAHAAPRILLTGAGDDEINREILLKLGVPATAIEVENKSTTTHENAVFSLKLLRMENIHRVILVTTWYHARRSQRTFQHYAPDIKFYSRPSYYGFYEKDWGKTGVGKRLRLEFVKLPGYWIRYGVNPF